MATSNPKIYSRAEWYAEPAKGGEPYNVIPKYIIIHHTDSNHSNKSDGAAARVIQYQHQLKGYGDVGYNYLVGHFGSIMEGRSFNVKGAHCPDEIIWANRNSAGIACILNSMTTAPSSAQYDSLISICAYVCKKYNVKTSKIKRHSDYYSTECPGTNLNNKMSDLKSKVKSLLDIKYPGVAYVYGSKGSNVKLIQERLNLLSSSLKISAMNCGTPDGSFGPATKNAVMAFQRHFSLAVDGSFGPASWNAMFIF